MISLSQTQYNYRSHLAKLNKINTKTYNSKYLSLVYINKYKGKIILCAENKRVNYDTILIEENKS